MNKVDMRLSRKDYLVISQQLPKTFFDEQATALVPWNGIRSVVAKCFDTAVKKGWWEKYESLNPDIIELFLPDIISSKIALMHSELSEALEEVRIGAPHMYYSLADPQDENPKPMGIAVELADCVIRIFDLSAWLGIDLAEVIRIKMAWNMTRSYKHGNKAI